MVIEIPEEVLPKVEIWPGSKPHLPKGNTVASYNMTNVEKSKFHYTEALRSLALSLHYLKEAEKDD